MSLISLIIAAGLICAITMVLTWLLAIRIDNYSIVDVTWSYNFPLIALFLFYFADGLFERKLITLLVVGIWGVRLGSHLLERILSHIKTEDGRYITLRINWAPNLKAKFFSFYQMQAASNVFLAIPFFILMTNSSPAISWLEKVGFGIWLVAMLGETTADWQLANFKKNPVNKGKVCNVGLWSWSRHPNYFFEFLIWVAYATMAWSSPFGWIAIICPISILYLLFKVTGIPLTEQQAIKSKGQLYVDYQKTTSKFLPMPPKTVKS